MNTHNLVIRRGRKFDQVIDGARDVFLRDGFEGASVDDIARAAGVSKATLYSYFPDKASLFMEMATQEVQTHTQQMVQSVVPDDPPEKVLLRTGRGMMCFMLTDFGRRVFRICVAEADRFPELGRRFYEMGPGYLRGQLRDYLELCVSRGELQIEDLDLAADQFPELCKAELFPKLVFGVIEDVSEAEIDRVVHGAVHAFMTCYGRKPRVEKARK
ncbi:TetR/AcrR family transcriptional regulator [Shimia thalassica]|uniref:TetR/AcrR family transcriptional regulator n=1 Tax=Shimia thalassica TaxID=1715693 RepID=UPI00273491FD|nr:TetR/AcrR family transcriptional regulator [Shimia thalassica]MDP2493508.1 TetR/AcrR family transcriptional regulator [Shimia thalassica]